MITERLSHYHSYWQSSLFVYERQMCKTKFIVNVRGWSLWKCIRIFNLKLFHDTWNYLITLSIQQYTGRVPHIWTWNKWLISPKLSLYLSGQSTRQVCRRSWCHRALVRFFLWLTLVTTENFISLLLSLLFCVQ